MIVLIPSFIVFAVSSVYLVVENNYRELQDGWPAMPVHLKYYLPILFDLLDLFLGSSLLTLVSKLYTSVLRLVILYNGIAFFVRRKTTVILDERNFSSRNLVLEMLEANLLKITLKRCVNEGFKAWMVHSFFPLTKKMNLIIKKRHLI
ncbi:hypothetical protein Ahy_B02g061525 [Arachis hypogaea]|uniref:Uncharacterized protein n=1 Tax=Arachis hypogaea TaxID=3818 RepID=A0A445AL72_ARAHY|nr:hypothetical protein Ahy_B02g061525 [Arachis hypogaea]